MSETTRRGVFGYDAWIDVLNRYPAIRELTTRRAPARRSVAKRSVSVRGERAATEVSVDP
jgi:hypothetical protein